jgi:hypothetical protein
MIAQDGTSIPTTRQMRHRPTKKTMETNIPRIECPQDRSPTPLYIHDDDDDDDDDEDDDDKDNDDDGDDDLDSLTFSGLPWTFKFLPSKHTETWHALPFISTF